MMLMNKKGFTAIEIAIGIGVVAILTTAVLATQLMVTKEQVKLQTKLEESIDTNLAERVVFSDLNAVEPSYNNLTVKDDKGLSFFDYYPDVPANLLGNKEALERNITLNLKGRTELFILLQDLGAGPLMNYDPVAAYDIGAAPADFNKSATLSFSSLNRNKWVEKQRESFWKNGRALMLDTPARLRPINPDGSVDMKIAPRSPIYIGYVDGNALKIDATIKGLIDTTEPESGKTLATVDEFLRAAPSIGGGQSLIRMRAVRLVRYYLEAHEDLRYAGTPANLYKSIYENGQWSSPYLMADGVEEFQLRRDSVLKRMIYFKVKKMDKKDPTKTAGL
ncbi:MAG: hypothetical protein OM95_02630 [Bdellovibrio sp. ArHS]|uniref:type II secretion system protein n=1 Tax=Bdellovibrio sp. ArHS TaxID=1569284 RepID=UPI000582F955|nr:type II secretion system protein [Bdellovibrio sp. ArHS]KHD89637.1 MAG: hypothetical protein OM95_02630 [Bdellovibrio sp. ArHS]